MIRMIRLQRPMSVLLSALLGVPIWLLALASVSAPAHASSAGTVYIAISSMLVLSDTVPDTALLGDR